MALQFQRQQLIFLPASGGPQRRSSAVTFPGVVRRADVALRGFNIGFTNNAEHPFARAEIDLDPGSVDGQVVNFSVDFALRDASGNFDDPFNGFVEVLVIADVV